MVTTEGIDESEIKKKKVPESYLFAILGHLYTNKSCKWINDYEDRDISPFMIQNWLLLNENIRIIVRWLDKYTFKVPPKMYLSLAWSLIPKSASVPFRKYIKQKKEEEEYDFILSKISKHLELSENDYNSCKERLIKMIKDDYLSWFSYYGIDRFYWKKYHVDFNKIKEFEKKEIKTQGLAAWGIGG
jgi:hypothetical protein